MVIYTQNDTIAAISTPVGTGGIGVVRISGGEALAVIQKIFTTTLKEKRLPEFEANKIYYGWIHECHSEGSEESSRIHSRESLVSLRMKNLIDEVVLLCFNAPNSFTGEDVFEIQCHGGVNVVKNILRLCLKSGARMAEQGEFSKRAFINGKLDLSKAEAVIDLIHSKTDMFSKVSAMNLSGRLAEKISNLRNELMTLLSVITAAVDFPEEVEEPEYAFVQDRINFLIKEIENILTGSVSSNLMRRGINVAIAGKPNVGKSSLFNALLDMQRAIVTEIPGTTRDVIKESIDIEGIPVTLIDTAGLRELNDSSGADYIESIGINLTKEFLENADVVLYMHDLTRGISQEDIETCKKIKNKLIKVGSKCDLTQDSCEIPKQKGFSEMRSGSEYFSLVPDLEEPQVIEEITISENRITDSQPTCRNCIKISSKTKAGLDELKAAIKNTVFSGSITNMVDIEFSTNLRQQERLKTCGEFLSKSLKACQQGIPQDLFSIDLKSALICLGEITGEVASKEIIDNIFSKFCIGK